MTSIVNHEYYYEDVYHYFAETLQTHGELFWNIQLMLDEQKTEIPLVFLNDKILIVFKEFTYESSEELEAQVLSMAIQLQKELSISLRWIIIVDTSQFDNIEDVADIPYEEVSLYEGKTHRLRIVNDIFTYLGDLFTYQQVQMTMEEKANILAKLNGPSLDNKGLYKDKDSNLYIQKRGRWLQVSSIDADKHFYLMLFLGIFGLHKFKEKRVLAGIAYLFTLGGLGCFSLIDSIWLLIGLYKDKENRYLAPVDHKVVKIGMLLTMSLLYVGCVLVLLKNCF